MGFMICDRQDNLELSVSYLSISILTTVLIISVCFRDLLHLVLLKVSVSNGFRLILVQAFHLRNLMYTDDSNQRSQSELGCSL
jgi:hypothetical protein